MRAVAPVATPDFATRARAAHQAVKALQCLRSVPERMLAFAAAPEDVRRRVLELWTGGGPEAWPCSRADTDILKCAPFLRTSQAGSRLTRSMRFCCLPCEAMR